ncbi:MAG: MBL fold metallo-hydrolase [Candidatus Moranbacteria bacterium]|jgi:L-ascorbate metabolism protein UlaG (beta-lactamase superfamily)|nr:MBL fold metallo-hydrolase [Candidatus Moranbacteria bacterium]
MKITKFGHCCLLIEEGSLRILTDPGNYNVTPDVEDIDIILITHEHQDHLHVDALKEILIKNPDAKIISHLSVGKILDEANITYSLIADGEEIIIKDISIESCGSEHACIHHDLPKVQNTGFYINKTLFYPGDSFHNPDKDIRILALPVSGPWMKLEEAIEYAKFIKPKVVFPVHDGMLRQEHQLGPTRRIPSMLLEPLGIKFVDMKEGSIEDFSNYLS